MKKNIMTLLTLMLAMMFSVSALAENPAAVSNISSVADVPLITLNNGVQVPQLGLGTQIQSLERDSSEAGRYFNIDYQRMGGFFTTLNE